MKISIFSGHVTAALLLTIAPLGSAPAQAASLVSLTWTGNTLQGVDQIGLFGEQTTVFAPTTYVATYVYDTSISFFANPGSSEETVSGGTFFNPFRPSPLVSASITVNGVVAPVGGSFFSQYFVRSGPNSGDRTIFSDAITGFGLDQGLYASRYSAQLFNTVRTLGNFSSLSFNQNATYVFGVDDNVTNAVFRLTFFDTQDNAIASTGFGLVPTSLTIAGVTSGAVPEPASWALLIAGFGLVGAAMRRRTTLALASR